MNIKKLAEECIALDARMRADDLPSINERFKRWGIPFQLSESCSLLAQALLIALEALEGVADITDILESETADASDFAQYTNEFYAARNALAKIAKLGEEK